MYDESRPAGAYAAKMEKIRGLVKNIQTGLAETSGVQNSAAAACDNLSGRAGAVEDRFKAMGVQMINGARKQTEAHRISSTVPISPQHPLMDESRDAARDAMRQGDQAAKAATSGSSVAQLAKTTLAETKDQLKQNVGQLEQLAGVLGEVASTAYTAENMAQ